MSKLPELGRSAVPEVNAGHKQALDSVRGLLRQNLSDLESGSVNFRVTGEREYPKLELLNRDKYTVRHILSQLLEMLSDE